MTSTAEAAHAMLDKETDARFYAQTGYRPGHKLDMSDPTDKAMSKVWIDINNKVKAEDKAGKLVLTYNHPAVEKALDNAKVATEAAVVHADVAATAAAAGDDAKAAKHTKHAHHAAAVAATEVAHAAQHQPPVVSPEVAQVAAEQASVHADEPAPPHWTEQTVVHPKHPARGPRAQPHPATIQAGHMEVHGPVIQIDGGSAAVPIDSTEGRLALAQAQNAPRVAAAVHAATVDLLPAKGTVSPEAQDQLRTLGRDSAEHAQGQFVGTVLDAAGTWQVVEFHTADELLNWYFDLIKIKPTPYKYAAAWDKTPSAGWPDPAYEMYGDARALLVQVAPCKPERRTPPAPPAQRIVERVRCRGRVVHDTVEVKTTNMGAVAAIGAVAITAGLAVFAGRKKASVR